VQAKVQKFSELSTINSSIIRVEDFCARADKNLELVAEVNTACLFCYFLRIGHNFRLTDGILPEIA
jgi:hypothetical protein